MATVLEPGGRALTQLPPAALVIDPLPAYAGLQLGAVDARSSSVGASVRLVASDGSLVGGAAGTRAGLGLRCYHEDWITVVVHENGSWQYQSRLALTAVGLEQPLRLVGGAWPRAGSSWPAPAAMSSGWSTTAPARWSRRAATCGGQAGSWGDVVSREHPDRAEVVIAPVLQSPPPRAIRN